MSKVTQAIAAVSAALSEIGIGKDRKNEAQGFKFRGIDDVLNIIAPIYAEHGLVVIPRFTNRMQVERRKTVEKGGKTYEQVLYFTTLDGTFSMFHKDDPSGLIEAGPFPGEAMDSADKSTNKAMSAAYKYFALMTFAIPVVGTPDSDADESQPPETKPVDTEGWIKTFAGTTTREELLAAWTQAKKVCVEANNPEAAKLLLAARDAHGKSLAKPSKKEGA
jgi:hypothetical protein